MIDLLERLYKVYSGERKVETASYRNISDYFIKLPPKDTVPLAPSFDNESEEHQSQSLTASISSGSEDSIEDDSVAHGVVVFSKVHLNLRNCHFLRGLC
jgi:hypothetical protein